MLVLSQLLIFKISLGLRMYNIDNDTIKCRLCSCRNCCAHC